MGGGAAVHAVDRRGAGGSGNRERAAAAETLGRRDRAGSAGLALLGASVVWPRCEPAAKWLRRLGWIAFAAVVVQGVLGGLRVVFFDDAIGIFHATLAQLFFVLTLFHRAVHRQMVGAGASPEALRARYETPSAGVAGGRTWRTGGATSPGGG